MDLFEKAYRYHRADDLRSAGLYPYFRAIQESAGGTNVVIDGRRMVMAGSNNYLGLTHDPRVVEAAQRAVRDFGTGCTGSRFLNGTLRIHEEMEERLADFLKMEACITSGTGFQTNVGLLGALCGREDVIFGDRDNHASIIDGCRLSFAKLYKYRHNDVLDLERLLGSTRVPDDGGRLIITDGVFSMLGDLAPLPEIVELAKRYDARTVVDDAHGLGVLGEGGRGTCEHFGVLGDVDIIVGTFSKSFACLGGFIAGPRKVIDTLKHTSRSIIFSASMTPSSVATVLACLDIIHAEPERRERLWRHVERMKVGLESLGLEVVAGGSPILSVVTGDETTTMEANRLLFEQGVFVNAVLPPAAPPGQSLLRTSYMATHSEDDLDRILEAFRHVAARFPVLRRESVTE
ncbi:MAG: pyridoxal phosphate-dependent aminotransferase family protein [Planctomycetes bacterium]|nr:pyridoxal phosphate-dependent aminotransferase family protein [Planctomycetota bacterium]MCB9825744.1 pyridoxal phosphate-dependent aminotransferase family protein [Planctomycetota bacterium]MCB9830007.1 pyridoxal phosphate-dependent aminotransferase family protein [Planctomycetota bacterium]